MIHGHVNEEGVPVIEIEIGGQTWLATIDTGFSGDLELPYSVETFVNPRYWGPSTSYLASSVVVTDHLYEIDVPFDGEIISALACFVTGDMMLIGTNILRPYCLVVDFPADTVMLERED